VSAGEQGERTWAITVGISIPVTDFKLETAIVNPGARYVDMIVLVVGTLAKPKHLADRHGEGLMFSHRQKIFFVVTSARR
jgi:hypothetical protein